MVSARKLAANRANAQASTGPRTAAGKARASRNAVRHGLAGQGWTDPETGRAIERWGRKLAGEATGEERELAYRIAAAQVELERVREARRRLYARPAATRAITTGLPDPPPSAPEAAGIDYAAIEETMADTVWELDALERYEGRAVARRRRAIAALDALRAGEPQRQRLPRPVGIRLPRWRLPDPFGRVIKFEGLPRWAWWRPDPLDEPAPRLPRRRNNEPPVAGELEVLLRPEVLFRLPPAAPPPETLHLSETKPPPDPAAAGGHAGADGADAGVLPVAEHAAAPTSALATAQTAAVLPPALDAEPQHWRETNPPSDPATSAGGPDPTAGVADAAGEPDLPVGAALADPAPATAPPFPQPAAPRPRQWGATPTPLPTCRVGPCRWVGPIPADHWSYRGWRWKRKPARGPPWRLA
jgi:hypothetical protein